MPMLMPVRSGVMATPSPRFFLLLKECGGLTISYAHAYAKTRVSLGGGLWLPLLPSSLLLEERGGLGIIYAHAHAHANANARSPTVFLFFYLLEGGGQAYQPALPVPVPVPKLVRSRLAATLSVFFSECRAVGIAAPRAHALAKAHPRAHPRTLCFI